MGLGGWAWAEGSGRPPREEAGLCKFALKPVWKDKKFRWTTTEWERAF